jgi:poly(ADP-ribose) glycohydrolase ARH3
VKPPPPTEDRYAASLLGLALGDAMGAAYEGGPFAQLLWKALGVGSRGGLRWTDDTQMALGLTESLLERDGLDPDHLARIWAEGATWERGYGAGTIRLLRLVRKGADWREANRSVFPDGSYGNGAAMRAAPLGLYFRGRDAELREAAALAASITHAHPLGIEGGVLIARAVSLALEEPWDPEIFLDALLDGCRRKEYRSRLGLARSWLSAPPEPKAVARELGTSIRAHESAVTAVHAFLRSDEDFAKMMDFVIGLGGDTDTIGAMAGGIFGARHGLEPLPGDLLDRLEDRGRIETLGRELHGRCHP